MMRCWKAGAWSLLSLALVSPVPVFAQSTLLKDIHPGNKPYPPASIRQPAAFGGKVYFLGQTHVTGTEAWQTDGTPAGTSLMGDLAPGPDSSISSGFVDMAGALYFTARQGQADSEALWKSDGTVAGTVRLKSALLPGWADESAAGWLTRMGTRLFFTARFDDSGTELWKSDGTEAGTVRVKDLHPGPQGSKPRNLQAGSSTLYFIADSGGGEALWRSDGSEAGTFAVQQFAQGFSPTRLSVIGDTALLLLLQKESLTELWKSDGTAAGTVKLTDLPGSQSWRTSLAGGRLFLSNRTTLWTSDGTPGGTGELGSFESVDAAIQEVGGAALFFASTQDGPSGLWRSDGTEAGTTLVSVPGLGGESFLGNASTGSAAFFFRYEEEGVELWKTDGTAEGTVRVKLIPPGERPRNGYGVSIPGAAGDQYFFEFGYTRQDGSRDAFTLWRSDGTPEGTYPLVSPQQRPASSRVAKATTADGVAFFAAEDGTGGRGLWKTDGTPSGTTKVKDLTPGILDDSGGAPDAMVRRPDGTLFILVRQGSRHRQTHRLWKSDGTDAGTVLLKEFETSYSFAPILQLAGDTVYFAAQDEAHRGIELWKSDGTAAGTVRVKDILPGTGDSDPTDLWAVGSTLYFVADDGVSGRELWKSDGTEAGTVRVKDLHPGENGGPREQNARTHFAVVGNTLYFLADDGVHGLEPWKTDGTEAGTVLLKDIRPGAGDGAFGLYPVGATLYLVADDGVHGFEPWKSDGTPEGTVMLKDIVPGAGGGYGAGFTRLGEGSFFLAFTPEHGIEPWKTDGTEAGTVLLKDVLPGPDGSLREFPASLVALEDRGLAVFAATDGTSGEEVWVTDGTPEGTERVADVVPGAASSVPRGMVRVGERLVFVAMDPTVGLEPHVLPLPVRKDRLAPVVSCPAAVKAEAAEAAGTVVTYPPATATDASGEPTLRYSVASGSTFPVGTTQVTVTAADAAGNESRCTFDVTVTRKAVDPIPEPSDSEGCSCRASGGAGSAGLWSVLALLVGTSMRRRRSAPRTTA